ncbi:hypothetical protein GQ53DRAFT_773620 [Thozetella sp. PMI_491]|nr:hypothetical protein GQ53DRAFT_773620 [Thozetella sp. PMI_491]
MAKTALPDEVVMVRKLLGPLSQEDVPILRCVRLNYSKHEPVPETGRKLPTYPLIFLKPNTKKNPAYAGVEPHWGFSEDFCAYVPRGPYLVQAGFRDHAADGSIIMAGNAGDVSGAMKAPRFLQPGTQMEVSITKIGTLRNKVKFALSRQPT